MGSCFMGQKVNNMKYKDIEVYKENKDIFFRDVTKKTFFYKFIKENIRFLKDSCLKERFRQLSQSAL